MLMKLKAIPLATALLGVAAVVGGWLIWYMLIDPLSLLPEPHRAIIATDAPSPRAPDFPGRRVKNIRFDAGMAGDIRISVSLPKELSGKQLPVFVLLGGLRTGRANVFYIDTPGDNALLGFEYPLPKKIEDGWTTVHQLRNLRHQALLTPAQIVSVLYWLRKQPWVDTNRISLVGVSLGALYLPAVQNLAQHYEVGVRHLVIAYGGAGISDLVADRLRFGPAWVREMIGAVAEFALRPVEPSLHLPSLSGDILLINSVGPDKFMPASSVQELHRLTPEPKTMVSLKGGHIDQGGSRLVKHLVDVASEWLRERNAMNR
ncbi:MAG: hypothetical protein CMM60_11470 [Rhodospirillaceae bacterium]|jgi:hypothetical protein|nr:hypothetical protein [Rhodospirillaceae bacterium]|tara:strand:- start:10764 stop:11714 length:951 start_codon:yes stop_codon:yes gene_type:complete